MKLHGLPLLAPICILLSGCGSETEALSESGKMVFVDTETMNPMVLPTTDSVPAVNPETGRRTLMPGLFCSDCMAWYPAPPVEQVNRQPGSALCPKTGTPLVADGPRPSEKPSPGDQK